MRKYNLIFIVLILSALAVSAARVDTLSVHSSTMKRDIKVLVVVPELPKEYPSVYLLHGYSGKYHSWLGLKPELLEYADRDGVLFVCPDGENSWYWDSPSDPGSQFETFVSKELVAYIDTHYATCQDKNMRAITGLSMGGHGAMWLAIRHPEVFGSAGSMSGGLDIRPFPANWEMSKQIGAATEKPGQWEAHTVINQIENLKPGALNMIICCGYDDFFFDVNEAFHQKLLKHGIMHDYIVRPGAHTGEYWKNAIDYHLLFFTNIFKQQ